MKSSTFRAEKIIEELKNNPYYEKYSKKISAYQKFVVYQIEVLIIMHVTDSGGLG
jgi:hypothetical protein